jgi:sec-independent protein translocase protein TatA
MPFGIQPLHIIVVVIVALIIFGPARLPEIGRGLGKAINEFRKGAKEMTEGFREEVVSPGGAPTPPVTAASSQSQPSLSEGAPSVVGPQQPASGNFCTQCGAPNPPGSRFCNKCGAQLPA